LKPLLTALADETRTAEAPYRVRATLLAELAARRRRRLLVRWAPAFVAVAAMLLVAIVLKRPAAAPPPAPQVVQVEPPAAPAVEVEEDRVVEPAPRPLARRVAQPVAPVQRRATPWFVYSGLPLEAQGQVVNIEVSNSTAASFGVVSARPRVPAQVFIGDDGLARAIRFVH
jgi:hypothetical protein